MSSAPPVSAATMSRQIAAAARRARIVKSGNMSLGVNLLAALVRKAASALGEEFDIEIAEMHHRMKIDAPSGTALLLGEAAARGRSLDLEKRSVRGRDGVTGARPQGGHRVREPARRQRGRRPHGDRSRAMPNASSFRHRAESRDIFARGAVRAALWAADKEPGLYSMADVLGLAE